jgi:hypothetical protein
MEFLRHTAEAQTWSRQPVLLPRHLEGPHGKR